MNGILEINGHEVDITFDYEFIAAAKGSTNEYGVPIEPDEPASVEITSIKIGDSVIELPEELMNELEEELLEGIIN